MRIISHRGWWRSPAEKNTMAAFERSFAAGYGTETDVRDLDGQLVISHDMPLRDKVLPLQPVLDMAHLHGVPLAINIKADGLAQALQSQVSALPGLDWFVFDMSVPDMRGHLSAGNPTYTRCSEVERQPAYLERASGIWLDALDTPWLDAREVSRVLAWGKPVCLVSPELHRRDPIPLWKELMSLQDTSLLTLCTDLPDQARHHILGVAP
ncbi:phosphodiesterase [Aquabacterium soli]|jgi:hypothetical protein|uniref:Phosphodiesterase n=1 Tax=Aquabacterium soli TaxID=2493092 RepID=A0A3R8S331_9BURK|nr:phosphodiesterase [Aquabacterium soli]RRS04366.1 phosphodiesterase [Aquabacterium soli]